MKRIPRQLSLPPLLLLFLPFLLLASTSQVLAQGSGWIFPSASTYSANIFNNGQTLSSENAPGASITVSLPVPSTVGASWHMSFSTAKGKGVIANTPTNIYIYAGEKQMTSFSTPSNKNYEYFEVESDGTNFRLVTATDATKLWNGVDIIPGNWTYLYSSGYTFTLADNARIFSTAFAGQPIIATLPSSPLLPNGWSIGLYTDQGVSITIQKNSVQGGTLIDPQGNAVNSYTIPATYNNTYALLSFDGASFRFIIRPVFSPNNIIDPRSLGLVCGLSDSTSYLNQAATQLASTGGTILVPCPITVAGMVTLGSNIKLAGISPIYYPSMTDTPGPSVWPPTSGPSINCTGTTVTFCILVNGIGTHIENINFGNPQPPPPSVGDWHPTVFPFVIGTTNNSGWQGLTIRDVTCTACSHFIDLEGTPNYATFSGNQITIEHLWCNACLEDPAIELHRIDNKLYASDWNFIPQYYGSTPSMGGYERQHAVSIDMKYVAAPQFNGMNFFAGVKSAITAENDTVTNNFGTLNFAVSAAQFVNTQFNQVCQAVTLPGGNGTIVEFYFTTLYVWGDQSGFNCSAGKAMFDMPSNDARLWISQAGIAAVDTLTNIGCGVPGTGGCPAGGPGGGALARLDGMFVDKYSTFSAGQPFVKAPSTTTVSFGTTDISQINVAPGGGNIMGPGVDGTQAGMASITVGGGQKGIQGAIVLQGGDLALGTCCASPPARPLPGFTGYASFWFSNNVRGGYIGRVNDLGLDIGSDWGSIFLKPNEQTPGSPYVSIGTSFGTTLQVNMSGLPPAPPSGTAGGAICFDSIGNLYAKSSCP
jgi:hypothetical protein